jgi:hypothetical protein
MKVMIENQRDSKGPQIFEAQVKSVLPLGFTGALGCRK